MTKSGSNQFHGSAYEFYRSTGMTATPYFNGGANPIPKPALIRNVPGASFGGPILKNKLFFFGSFERHTDRSQTTVSRTVPTPSLMQGIIQYQRTAAAFAANGQQYGVITQGCGGDLEKITLIPCDAVNPAVIGPNGYLQQYAPYVSAANQCTDCSNFATFRFNAPNISNQNIYISRIDYTINSKNTFYVRGTLNNAAALGPPTFPNANNALTTYDDSKGFAASLNTVLTPTINNNFTVGLTRQAGNITGAAAPSFSFGPSSLFQTTGASSQAIDTWNFVDNLSLIKGSHTWQVGVNFSFVNNYLYSFATAKPPSFTEAANQANGTIGVKQSTELSRALGTEFANVANPITVGDAIFNVTGSFDLFSEGLQYDTTGNQLPAGSPFVRNIRMDQYDLYTQDSWKVTPSLTLTYGIHWGVVTPPWERNGQEVNWTENLGNRYQLQRDTTLTQATLPLYTTQAAGRANNLPDYYAAALNNWAPRASFAYTATGDGILGKLERKGGPLVIRGGYALSFDHTGGAFGANAATTGSIGLLTAYGSPSSYFSIDGATGPRAPRVGGTGTNLILPYGAFSIPTTQSFVAPGTPGGWGGVQLPGIDSNMRPPSNHLVNFTISKELPGGFVLEASYVGRFARGLLGVLDLATPPNVIDPASGQDYYAAMKTLFEQYEYNSVGAGSNGTTTITAANAVAATSSLQPIPWLENVYGQNSDPTKTFKALGANLGFWVSWYHVPKQYRGILCRSE